MTPKIIQGNSHKDQRGSLSYNNSFDASAVKRMYVIENDLGFIRRWQGHKIEQRWFTAVSGRFKIQLIQVDDWKAPAVDLEKLTFELVNETFNVLHIPNGYVTSIQALADNSKLLVMSNYFLNEIKDEYRYPVDYFKKK